VTGACVLGAAAKSREDADMLQSLLAVASEAAADLVASEAAARAAEEQDGKIFLRVSKKD